MELWNSLPQIVRHIILGVVLFLAGGTISFWYSYRPLHGALTWKVESLESRLDERNHEFIRLKDEFESVSKDESERIDPETFAQIESELAKTKQALKTAESESKRLDKKRRDANATADRWRKRFESLRDQQSAAPAAKESLGAEPSPSSPLPLSGPDLDTSRSRNPAKRDPTPNGTSFPGPDTNGHGKVGGAQPGSDARRIP